MKWAKALGVIVALAVGLIAVNWLRAATACAWDTSTCAFGRAKNGFYGGAFLPTGSNRLVAAEFGSRTRLPAIELKVRPDGAFCIVWAHEREATATAPVGTESLGASGYRSVNLGAWHSEQTAPMPKGCQKTSTDVPWDRADDLMASWQFWTLIGLPVLALAGIAVGRILPRRGRTLSMALAAVAVTLGLVLSFELWS